MKAIKEQLCGIQSAQDTDKCQADEFVEVKQRLPDEVWRNYFVFTVVRNPWNRMLSAFNMFNYRFLHRCAFYCS